MQTAEVEARSAQPGGYVTVYRHRWVKPLMVIGCILGGIGIVIGLILAA